jgi:putative transposase/transposase-like zinc-binding protein
LVKRAKIPISRRSPLQEILVLGRDHWDHDNYDPDSRRAFQRASRCKTPAMGGRIFASEREETLFYNTCKSPACPSCGHWATIQWQRERWSALPDGPYVEITLTMPDTLWGIFARNASLCRKLPEIAARVIRSYARVHYGVEVGVMPVLHTFNGELLFKPHVHSLVTAGGLQAAGARWTPRIFFDRDAIMRSWQRLIIALLREASETAPLESQLTRDQLESLLRFEETRGWIAHVRRFKGKEHFLRYCGRYVRRPPIAQWRILSIKNGLVRFWHKDKRLNRWITVQCTLEVFIDRWSRHIPKLYRHAVRHFGLFAPRRWPRVAPAVFTILSQKQRPRPKRLPWALAVQGFRGNPLLDQNGQLMKFARHLPAFSA